MRKKTLISFVFLIGVAASVCNGQIKLLGADRIKAPEGATKYNLLQTVDPDYPAELREHGIHGRVVVKILIDKQGAVASATGLEGNSALVDSTLKAVKQWKFRPYIQLNGPVEVETTVTVDFAEEAPYVRANKPLPGPLKLRVSQGVAEKGLMRKVEPFYPLKAMKKHIEGDVILRLIIDEQGNVADLAVLQGDPILADSALAAVKHCKYKPYLLNGQRVQVETTVRVCYRMQRTNQSGTVIPF